MCAPRTIISLVFLALAGAGVLTACSDSAACESDSDCFGGETCRGGQCLVVVGSDAGNNNTSTNNDTDGGTGNNSGTDTGGSNNNTGEPECVADPFEDSCEDDQYEPNEEWIESAHVFDANTPFGCFSEFRPIDETITATLCPLETADYYDFSYNTCKDHAYYIDFEFRPTNQCTQALVNFEFKNHPCDEENTSCEQLENGGLRIRHIVEQTPVQSQNQAAYFAVSPGSSDQKVKVPYEITVKLHK